MHTFMQKSMHRRQRKGHFWKLDKKVLTIISYYKKGEAGIVVVVKQFG